MKEKELLAKMKCPPGLVVKAVVIAGRVRYICVRPSSPSLGRIDVTPNWVRHRLESPRKFFKDSFRVKHISGGRRLIIACPRGRVKVGNKRLPNWDAKRKICRVGTRAQSIMTPRL